MKKIIVDLQFSESYSLGLGLDSVAALNKFKKNQDSLYLFYASVLGHYNMSFQEFNEAMEWYKKEPEQMDSLITASMEELAQQKEKYKIKEVEDGNIPSEGRRPRDLFEEDLRSHSPTIDSF